MSTHRSHFIFRPFSLFKSFVLFHFLHLCPFQLSRSFVLFHFLNRSSLFAFYVIHPFLLSQCFVLFHFWNRLSFFIFLNLCPFSTFLYFVLFQCGKRNLSGGTDREEIGHWVSFRISGAVKEKKKICEGAIEKKHYTGWFFPRTTRLVSHC